MLCPLSLLKEIAKLGSAKVGTRAGQSGSRSIIGMKIWRKPLNEDQSKLVHNHVGITGDRCKGCRFCIEFCPRKVLRESEGFNAKGYHPACASDESFCAGCGLCEMICPEFAISVIPAPAQEEALVSK